MTVPVTLREESLSIERRAVDRSITDADRLFQDRTIEAAATSEEAVVSKTVRVTEEIVVSKGAEERVTRVHAKVRRTEVEVDDDRRVVRGAVDTKTVAPDAASTARDSTTETPSSPGVRRR